MNKEATRTIDATNGVSEMDIPRSTLVAEPSKSVADLKAQVERLMGSLRDLKDEHEAITARDKVLVEGIARTEGAVMVLNGLIQEMAPQERRG